MPKTLQDLMAEDSALRPTSAAVKQNWVWLASVMIGTTICVPVFQFGAMLGSQLSFLALFLSVFAGGLLAGLMALGCGYIGQQTGLTSSLIIRQTFGRQGYLLANAAFVAACIGWFGIQTGIFANAFTQTFATLFGVNLSFVAVALVSGLLMSTTAVIGYRGLGKLSYIAVPMLLVLLVSPLAMLLWQQESGAIFMHQASATAPSFGTVVGMVTGAYIAAIIPDLTRFMKTRADMVKGIVVNHMLVYPLLLLLTGTLAMLANGQDLMSIMLALNFGSLALVVLFFATWTTNDANVYSGAVTLNPFFPQLERWQLAAIAGTFGTIAAAFGIFEHFMSWLIMLGVVFSPIAGVMLTDYVLHPQQYTAKALGKGAALRPEPVAAWVLGTLVGYCVTSTSDMGAGLFSLSGIPALDSFVVAAGALLVFSKMSKKR
jgi:cytosine permease